MNSVALSPVRAALARMGAYIAAYEAGDANALDALDRIDLSLASNVEDEILFLENLDAQLEKATQAIKIAKERVKALENLRDRVGDNLLADMNEHGLEEIEGLTRRVAAVRNGGVQATIIDVPLGTLKNVIPQDEDVPEQFVINQVVRTLDVEGVRRYLASGGELTWARVLPRGKRLSFKPL